jgi:hypothetical protein
MKTECLRRLNERADFYVLSAAAEALGTEERAKSAERHNC